MCIFGINWLTDSDEKTLLLILLLCAVAAAFLYLSAAGKEAKTAVGEHVENDFRTLAVTGSPDVRNYSLEGIAVPAGAQSVSFSVGGLLENGEMKLQKGTHFRRNQLLWQVNNSEAFEKMLSAKEKLRNKLAGLLPEIKAKFPSEQQKWEAFHASLEPGKLLSAMPDPKISEEQKYISEKGILAEYSAVKKQELGMSDFFLLAPFDGIVTDIFVKAGQQVAQNQPVMEIARNGQVELKCLITSNVYESLDSIREIRISDSKGNSLGEGKIRHVAAAGEMKALYITGNMSRKLLPGAKVSVELKAISQEMYYRLPASAVKSGQVRILSNGKPVMKTVKIQSEAKDHVLVSGLSEGDEVILN